MRSRCSIVLNFLARWLLLFAITFGFSEFAEAQQIVVNEWFATDSRIQRGEIMAGDEFIEFLITAPVSSTELANMTFGDTHHNTQQLNAVFAFDFTTLDAVLVDAGLDAFLPGTLIVAKGFELGPQDLFYNPLASNVGDHSAWTIELTAGIGFGLVPSFSGQSALDLSADRGDIVWIAEGIPADQRDTSGFIDALGVETNFGRIANSVVSEFGGGAILQDSTPNGSASVVRADLTSSEPPSFDIPTMGGPTEGGVGAAGSIMELRMNAVPEPSRAVLALMGILGTTLRRSRKEGFQ